MRYRVAVLALKTAGFVLFAVLLFAGKKKNPDDTTQTLELPKDPPPVAVGYTKRLVFRLSPLSGKGLLTQQTREALRTLIKDNSGAPVIHIRAFVAGSGDIRRVPQIVSEVFTEKKLPLPSVSVVLAGGLPLSNAQVALESVSISKREVNPTGLSFIAGEAQTDPDPAARIEPLLDRALAKVTAGDPLMVTCFVSSMPAAPPSGIDLIQTQRLPYSAFAQCEAVTRGTQVIAPKLAFSGTLLAFPRLDRDLSEAGADASAIVMTHVYPLSRAIAADIRKSRTTSAPLVIVPFEGLASLDAGFAVDAIAAVNR